MWDAGVATLAERCSAGAGRRGSAAVCAAPCGIGSVAEARTAPAHLVLQARPAPPSAQFAPRKNTLTNVKGDLWRAGDGTWFMGILNTPDGLLLVDTLNPTSSSG